MTGITISKGATVIMHFSIKLKDGTVADSTKVNNKPAQFQVGDGNLTESFENCLLGLSKGDERTFELGPDEAFGQANPDNIHHLDRTKFTAETPAEEGSIVVFTQPNGAEIPGIVREVVGDSVTVDFNHPLAGQTVTFEVEILNVEGNE
ncbi:FKBP-type peptidyl-prolyl cis-trans isomerase [Echinimonas agarilytica]|uniref:Peptidyl-prolyl cis-trans isomerase n=1 Tax=Echinimonas agarilytica TaxID=1215918 RepID=A0AA42B7W0_9GAMM|nr:FKBP-type peptidyl-prolyl cis-trans isomerase [Echinimonas agarilytica]MCM2680605.1 FKBP-type peptidyl-prolyl cis-trans isomerase [Echinimonas agarilytica]